MTDLDRAESVFRAAIRPRFEYAPPHVRRVLVVTDLEPDAAGAFEEELRRFLAVLAGGAEWTALDRGALGSVGDLVERVEKDRPDLVCTFRHLGSDAWRWPYALGEHVDVLTQAVDVPVLVSPHPERSGRLPHALRNTDRVLAGSRALSGTHRLCSFALRATAEPGTLHLAHVEDERTFRRYLDAIAKIPDLDTGLAERELRDRLLRDARLFAEDVADTARRERPGVEVRPDVRFGHALEELRSLIETCELDLLVLDSKEDARFAMSDLAYAVAVEVRSIPILLL